MLSRHPLRSETLALALLTGLAVSVAVPPSADADAPPPVSPQERRRQAVVVDEPDCPDEIEASETELQGRTASARRDGAYVAKEAYFQAQRAVTAYWDGVRARFEVEAGAQGRAFLADVLFGLDPQRCSPGQASSEGAGACDQVIGSGAPGRGGPACDAIAGRTGSDGLWILAPLRAIGLDYTAACPGVPPIRSGQALPANRTSFIRAALIGGSAGSFITVLTAGVRPAYCYLRVEVIAKDTGAVTTAVEAVLRVPLGPSPQVAVDQQFPLAVAVDPFASTLRLEHHCVARLAW